MSTMTSMLRLTGASDFGTYSSPTLSIKETSGVTTNYSLGSLSGTSISITFPNLNFANVKSASFSGITGGGSSVTDSLYVNDD